MSTHSEQRRAALADILGEKSVPWEQRIEHLSRFVEAELGRAFARGARASRMGGGGHATRPKPRVVAQHHEL